jgi:hypothetical protein
MATARLGHADLLLRDRDVAWRAIDRIGSRGRGTATGQPCSPFPYVDAYRRLPDRYRGGVSTPGFFSRIFCIRRDP